MTDLTYDFAAITLMQLGKFDDEVKAKGYLKSVVQSGEALKKFREFIDAQGGDSSVIDDYSKLPQAKFKVEIKSPREGYVEKIEAYKIAYGCKILGAGRETKDDAVDYSVGVYLNKKHGEFCGEGETLYTIYSNNEEKTKAAQSICDEAYQFSAVQTTENNLIYKIVK